MPKHNYHASCRCGKIFKITEGYPFLCGQCHREWQQRLAELDVTSQAYRHRHDVHRIYIHDLKYVETAARRLRRWRPFDIIETWVSPSAETRIYLQQSLDGGIYANKGHVALKKHASEALVDAVQEMIRELVAEGVQS